MNNRVLERIRSCRNALDDEIDRRVRAQGYCVGDPHPRIELGVILDELAALRAELELAFETLAGVK